MYSSGPRSVLSANRNRCLERAHGDLVAFIDDDVVLHSEFFGKAEAEYGRLSRSLGTDRVIVTGWEQRPDAPAFPADLNFLGFYQPRPPPGGRPMAVCINSTVFPRGLFERVRFDERIGYGAEERDVSVRARSRGYEIVYSEAVMNFHYPSDTNRNLYRDQTITSRMYFGLKRYSVYQKSIPRLALFLVYAPLNAIGHEIRHGRWGRAIRFAAACWRGWLLFREAFDGLLLEAAPGAGSSSTRSNNLQAPRGNC
jgi:glycosyltransferase involved in cell wall biosynthesis